MGEVVELSEGRNRFTLSRKELLSDYAAISRKRRGAAEASAIRHQSIQYLDILAFEATSGEMEWRGLRQSLIASMAADVELEGLEFVPLAEIGRVLLVNPFLLGDQDLGLFVLESAVSKLPLNVKSRRFRLLVVQRKIQLGDNAEARRLLELWKDVKRANAGYLEAEMKNPFRDQHRETKKEPTGSEIDKWLKEFNKPLVHKGLSPIRLRSGAESPFDRLESSGSTKKSSILDSAPQVSVILTAFQPSRDELLTSVNSILRQTYTNLELIIVDDASGSDFTALYEELESMDDRIKVIRLEENGGTYAARNVGLREARGTFFTGQDDDDWSHPERLEHQVDFLVQNPAKVGCRVNGLTCSPNLVQLRLGYKPQSSNASSLMVRTRDIREVGGFFEWRKAADTELVRRMERVYDSTVVDIPTPLTIIRILPNSLSRSEFKAGWSHPARRQLKSSYSLWHSQASKSELKILDGLTSKVQIPRRFRKETAEEANYHVVFAGDWRQYGGPQKSMIEEIRALKEAGYSVAIMHLEAPRFMSTLVKPMNPVIQDMVNSGQVDEVLYDDAVDVELLVLRYPPILQFVSNEACGLKIQKMFILANQAPSELDGSDVRYLVRDCMNNARRVFCENVTWVPQGPQVREFISSYLGAAELESFDFPGIVKASEWATYIPRRRRGTLPVIGRHSRDNQMKWPEDSKSVLEAYPVDGSADVRIMGGAQTPLKVLGSSTLPPSWVVFPTDAIPVPTFLRNLDFFVFFQNSNAVEAFGRAILEAIASNLVVILPPQFEQVFGEAAVYCKPEDVGAVVTKYFGDARLYELQQKKALSVLNEHFTHEAYVRHIGKILSLAPKEDK